MTSNVSSQSNGYGTDSTDKTVTERFLPGKTKVRYMQKDRNGERESNSTIRCQNGKLERKKSQLIGHDATRRVSFGNENTLHNENKTKYKTSVSQDGNRNNHRSKNKNRSSESEHGTDLTSFTDSSSNNSLSNSTYNTYNTNYTDNTNYTNNTSELSNDANESAFYDEDFDDENHTEESYGPNR